MGGGGTSTNTVQNASPWAPQQPYITGAFSSAQGNYNNQAAAGPYTGNFVSGNNPDLTAGEGTAMNYAQGAGSTLPTTFANEAGSLAGGLGQAQGVASGISNSGINNPALTGNSINNLNNIASGSSSVAGNPQLMSALQSGALTGANSLQGFTSGLQSATQTAAGNPTSQLINNAQQYENSSPVQSAINSTNSQIQQVLNEQTLPGLNQQAAAGGALNSSRAGMAEGMANEGAGIAEGNADSSILNNAYNTGLGTAANEYNTGLNASINGNVAGLSTEGSLATGVGQQQIGVNQNNTTNALNAVGQGINYGTNNASAQLAGANILNGDALNASGVATNAGNLASQNAGLETGAGATAQSAQNADYQNLIDQWTMQNQYPSNILSQYFGIVGTPAGTQGSSASSQQTGLAQQILGMGTGALGLASAYPTISNGLSGIGSGISSAGSSLASLFGGGAAATGLGAAGSATGAAALDGSIAAGGADGAAGSIFPSILAALSAA